MTELQILKVEGLKPGITHVTITITVCQCYLVKSKTLYSGNVNTKVSVNPGTLYAHHHTVVCGEPSHVCRKKKKIIQKKCERYIAVNKKLK